MAGSRRYAFKGVFIALFGCASWAVAAPAQPAAPDACDDRFVCVTLAAAQAEGYAERGRRLEAKRDGMLALMDEALPWAQRYEELIKTYPEADLRQAAAERDKVLAELLPRYHRLWELQHPYEGQLNLYEAQVAVGSAQKVAAAPGSKRRKGLEGRTAEPEERGAHLIKVTALRRSNEQLRAFLEKVERAQARDGQDYAAAIAEHQKRRRLGWGLGAGAAGLLLVLAVLAAKALRPRAG